jgi:hypothetical protein
MMVTTNQLPYPLMVVGPLFAGAARCARAVHTGSATDEAQSNGVNA